MKRNLLIIGALIFMISGACIQTGEHHSALSRVGEEIGAVANGKYVSVMHKSFDGAAINGIQVDLVSPDIKIIGDANGQTAVDVTASGNGVQSLSKEALMQRLNENYEIIVEQNGSQVDISIHYKKKNISSKKGLSFKFEVHTKNSVKTNVETVSGDIALRQLGACQVQSTSGDIDVNSIQGDGEFGSVSGDIKVSQVSGKVSMHSTSGDLSATSVGEIEKAETVSGDVHVEAGGLAGDVNLKSVSGDIVLNLPASTGADISLESVSGDLNIAGFDKMGSTSRSKRSMSAEINGGGAKVKGSTVSGDIKIVH